MRVRTSILACSLVFLATSGSVGTAGRESEARELIRAWNAYQVSDVGAMLSDDVVWDGPWYVNEGRTTVLGFVACDQSIGTQFDLQGVVASGDTALLQLVERSDLLSVLGVDSLATAWRVVFGDSGIAVITEELPDDDGGVSFENYGRFLNWAESRRAGVLDSLGSAAGDPGINGEACGVLMSLLREWAESRDCD